MKTATIIIALMALPGCTKPAPAAPENFGSQTTLDSLSAPDQTLVCVDPPIGADLMPYSDGREPTEGTFPCLVYDADLGGDGTCCGGDLRVQSCGAGLTCWKPNKDGVGVCSRQTFSQGTVCIDVESFHSADCDFEAQRSDANNCTVAAYCGNGLFQVTCINGGCSCYNYAALVGSAIAVADVCGADIDGALATAQAACNFPTVFSQRHVSW